MQKINIFCFILLMSVLAVFTDIKAQYITFMVNNSTQTYVSAINDSNFIAGYFEDASGTHGFIFNGTDTLKINYPGAAATYVYGINNNMVVVGAYTLTGSLTDLEGFSYDNKTSVFTDLTSGWIPSMDNTIARDVNEAGCIIGDYKQSTTHVAFSMCGGTNTPFHYNYNPTYVFGMNNKGKVVGLWIDGSYRKGLIYDGATWTEINYPGATKTNPTGINDSNVIVGVYDLTKSFIYKNGVFHPLTKPGATDFQVRCINNYGSVAGYYKDASGFYKGFYLPKWDIVFRPNPNGWRFNNSSANIWPGSWYNKFDYSKDPYVGGSAPFPPKQRNPLVYFDKKLFPDWPLFVEVFGESSCYIGSGPYKVFRGAAVLKWKKLAKDWGGSCFGFVQSSYMVWDSIQRFKSFFPETGPWSSSNLYDLTLNDHNRKCINYLMVTQSRKQLLTYYTSIWSEGPVITLKKTKQMMHDITNNDYRGLAMWNTNGNGGHIVNPYKILVDTIDTDIEYIYVYDNNMPDDTTRKITINKKLNRWYYNVSTNVSAPASQWGGANANYGLLLSWPSSDFYSAPVLDSLWTKTNYIEIYPTPNSSTVITNPGGDSTGYLNGKVISKITGGQPMYYFNSNDPVPYGYLLPDNSYSVTMQNYSDAYLDLSVVSGDKIYSYSRNNGNIAQKDIINIGTQFSVTNPDNSSKIFNLETFSSDSVTEMNIILDDLGISANGTLSFKWISNNKLEVVNQGQATSYDLDIRYVSGNGEFNFSHDNISFGANEKHIISPDWNNLQTQDVSVYIDNGNNGINDDTLYYGNAEPPQILTSLFEINTQTSALTDSIYITNTGGSSLNWTASSNSPSWLSITSATSGVNSGMIKINIAANSGASRSGKITITSASATNSPYEIKVNQAGVISVPTGLVASDGLYYDGVHLSWDAVSGATHYMVFRDTVAGGAGTAITGWSNSLSYIDVTATEGQFYYYSVKASQSSSGLNETACSVKDDGWRLCFTPDFSVSAACTGQPVLFKDNSNVHTNAWYKWDVNDDGSIDFTGDEFTDVFSNPGNVNVRLYVTDSSLCSRDIMKTLNVKSFPVVSLIPDTTICSWQSITLNAGSSFSSYLWSDGSTGSSIYISHPAYNTGDNYIYLQVSNANGCSAIDTTVVTFAVCSEIPAFEENSFNMNIYPNPADGIVNIYVKGLAGNTELNIYNINGQNVYSENSYNAVADWNRSFDFSGMPRGFYFVRIFNNDKTEVRKLVIY